MDEKALIGISFPNSRKDDLYRSVYDINVHYCDGPLSIPREAFQAMIIACLITSYRRPNLKNTESAGSTLVKSVNAGDPSEKQGFRDDTPYYLGKVLIEYPFTGFYRKPRDLVYPLQPEREVTNIQCLKCRSPIPDVEKIV